MSTDDGKLRAARITDKWFIGTETVRLGRHVLPTKHDEWSQHRQLSISPIVAFSESPLKATFEGNWPAVLCRTTVATPPAGSSYVRTPMTEAGHNVSWITASSELLHEIVSRYDPSCADRPCSPFEHVTTPTDPRASSIMSWLVAACFVKKIPIDPMLFDEAALHVLDLIARRSTETSPYRTRMRGATPRRHRDLVNSTCCLLATHYGEPLAIADLAQAVNISPAYLSRFFRLHTGLSIHQYLICTRLLHALDQVPGNTDSMASIALSCGFSSHAHLTSTCTSVLGYPPNRLDRKDAIANLGFMLRNSMTA